MPDLTETGNEKLHGTKSVFISAVGHAMCMAGQCPVFGAELKVSAQELVDFMLEADQDTLLILSDDEVRSAVRAGISNCFSMLESELSSLLLNPARELEPAESKILPTLSDIEWLSNILTKMDLTKDFVCHWSKASRKILDVINHEKFDSCLWVLKMKSVEITAKALEAVGYGTVILPAGDRAQLVKTWLPYMRKIKPRLEEKAQEELELSFTADKDLWQGIEGAVVSLVSALPSGDQAEILAEWMRETERGVRFPDMSEAFEVWCYRTKSAVRRLSERCDRLANPSATHLR